MFGTDGRSGQHDPERANSCILLRQYGLIGSGFCWGDSGLGKAPTDGRLCWACCGELLEVEKFCEADPVAPNSSMTVRPTE